MAAKSAYVLFVFAFVIGLVFFEQRLLRIVFCQDIDDQQPPGREDNAFRGFARCLHIFDVAEPVTLEERNLEPELFHVLCEDRLRRFDGPVDNGARIGGLDFGEHAGKVCGVFFVNLVCDDGNFIVRGYLLELFLACLAEAGIA